MEEHFESAAAASELGDPVVDRGDPNESSTLGKGVPAEQDPGKRESS